MRKLLTIILGASVLTVASVAWAAAADDGPRQDRLAGGGVLGPACSDGATPFCISGARSFSIDAAASPEGGGAYGRYFSGRTGGGATALTGRVTCLRVVGAAAVAGGLIVDAPAGSPDVFFVYMEDRATAGAGSDRVSANFIDFSTSPDLPAGFPRQCPPVDNDAFGFGYFTLTGGDVQVEDD